jgi:hypothetical protein
MNTDGENSWLVRQSTVRHWRLSILFLVPTIVLTACATTPSGSTAQRQVTPLPLTADADTHVDPAEPASQFGPAPATASQIEKQAKATEPKQSTDESAAASAIQVDPKRDRDGAKPRSDGRPGWWLESPLRQSGEVRVAAEALGVDLRDARRAAIDAGLRLLGRELGAEPGEWVVEATAIKPLRAVRGSDSVKRFVAYVLMSAQAPE